MCFGYYKLCNHDSPRIRSMSSYTAGKFFDTSKWNQQFFPPNFIFWKRVMQCNIFLFLPFPSPCLLLSPHPNSLWYSVSHDQGWPRAHYIVEDSLELMIPLPLPSKCWNYRCEPAHSAQTVISQRFSNNGQ